MGWGVQTTDRKTGVGEFEGKEVEGEREGGRKKNYLLQEVVVKISLCIQEVK